LNAPLTSIA
jgi:ATP-dependent exoDNAse (exonuclease V) alpha subunit